MIKNAPNGAHYFNSDNETYFRVEGEIVKEWRGNHWVTSDLNIELLDMLIDFDTVHPLMGSYRDILFTVIKAALIVSGVCAFISLMR